MLELPEAITLSRQLRETIIGKTITFAQANYAPHAFAWYYGDPQLYGVMLQGKQVTDTDAFGGYVQVTAGDMHILFQDGACMRYHEQGRPLPKKHQLHLDFDDGSALTVGVQMYGGILAFPAGMHEDEYIRAAKDKVSPLSDAFDAPYFASLLDEGALKLSAKAFLATKQRVPGLGNGVLQDILYEARIHPKRKMHTLSQVELDALFAAVKSVLAEMTALGGRDVESDLFGHKGGYATRLSRKTYLDFCLRCGSPISKQQYLGGVIYYCNGCQKEKQ